MKRIIKHFIQAVFFSLIIAVAIPSVVSIPGQADTVQAASVKLNKKSATLIKGQTLKLKVTGTNKTVKWSSSKKSVATVSKKGKVTAKKKGSATITAKVGGKKYSCKVKVVNPSISQKSATLAAGNSLKLSIDGTSKKVTWKSSDTKVAKVNSKGKVTAKKQGTATITATVLGKKFKCKITVIDKFSSSQALKNISCTIKENDYGVFYFVKNNYVFPVGLWGELLFYDKNGNVVNMDYDECWQIDPGDTYVLEFNKPTDNYGNLVSYSRYSINWEVDDPSDSGNSNKGHAKLTYKATKSSDGIMIAVTNNTSEKVYFRVNVLFYKNNELKWNDEWGSYEISAGKTMYLDCGYQWEDGGLIIPDKYEVYIG